MTEVLVFIIGVYWLIGGLKMLVDPKSAQRIVDQYEGNEALWFFVGVVVLVAGLALVQFHNIWTGWPEILVTVVIWAMIIEGAIVIVAPKVLFEFSRKIAVKTNVIRGFGFGVILLGAAVLFL